MRMGVCPQCQSECGVSDDGKYCLPHYVAGKAWFPRCDGSVNTEPQVVFDYPDPQSSLMDSDSVFTNESDDVEGMNY